MNSRRRPLLPGPLVPLAFASGLLGIHPSPCEVADSFRFPLDGEWIVTQDFAEPDFPEGSEKSFCGYHLGQDVRAEPGTPVYCIGNGTIAFVRLVAGLGSACVLPPFLQTPFLFPELCAVLV